jgi:aminoglycoside 6'-N-acetyltransferase
MTSTRSDDHATPRGPIDSRVALTSFRPAHLPLLARWLRLPHVARWYPEPEANLAWAASPPAGGAQAVIARGVEEVGYLRWQRVDRAALDALGLHEIPAGSVDVDILIGPEASIDKGLGPSALVVLAEEIRRDAGVALIGLTTSVENTRAHRAFAKAGFYIARQYDPNGLGPCHLMLRDLRRARATGANA